MKVITKDSVIKNIARNSKQTINDVKDFYDTLEDIIFDILSSVDENQDVQIKLFEGVSLDGKYIPEKMKKNNLTGKVGLVESKIRPKFAITRSYVEKLNGKRIINKSV